MGVLRCVRAYEMPECASRWCTVYPEEVQAHLRLAHLIHRSR
jgi:hypothetical protein